MYCVFLGSLDNLSALIRQYGLSKNTDEALLVIEAYRTLRDRGPYPADQVVKDLVGHFAFVIFDRKSGTVFAALVSRLTPSQNFHRLEKKKENSEIPTIFLSLGSNHRTNVSNRRLSGDGYVRI